MNCFIISLRRDSERRKALVRNLGKVNVPFSIIEGVNGSTLSSAEIKKYYDKKKGLKLFNNELSVGEIGCALSHIKIYEKMVAEDLDSALILEDDTYIVDDEMGALLKKLEDLYPKNLPVTVLLSCLPKYISNKKNIKIDEQYTIYDAHRGFSGSAYFITQAAAKILADNIFPVYVVADKWEYFQKKFFPVKVLIPNCIALSQLSLVSTIASFGDREQQKNPQWNLTYYFKQHLETIIFTLFQKPFLNIRRQENMGKI